MSDASRRADAVRARARAAAVRAGRDPAEVRIVAVAKTFPAQAVLELARAGLSIFGENRVQEAEGKLREVALHSPPPLEWHLVGRLQRNKAARAVDLFQLIHSVDRPELADALARAAERRGARQRVLLQIDLDGEPQKGGVATELAAGLLEHVEKHGALEAVGLMAIPRESARAELTRPAFARLRGLLERLRPGSAHPERLRELSMGMSGDFEVAIEEGATLVRIGTALFGERSRPWEGHR
jgi:hypothetical protein